MDKTTFSVTTLEASDDEREYWRDKTPDERFEGIEQIRQALYGYDPATARLQRVLEVAREPRR